VILQKERNRPPTRMPVPAKAGMGRRGGKEAPSSLEEGVGGGGAAGDPLRQRARAMRNNPTEPEKRLWHALKGKQLEGFKFRRQQAIGGRIVDFWCPRTGIAIEVDGETHDRARDLARDEVLHDRTGIVVLRFTNEDVMNNLAGVLLRILDVARERNHPPTPMPVPAKAGMGRRGRNAGAPSSPEEGVGGGGTS